MNTSLTTFDGYPRCDIDVAQVRTTRARIVRLKNDHKAIMVKVEAAVHEHFASEKSVEESSGATTSRAPGVQPANTIAVEPPFAKVNSVAANGPAETAGMRAGDKVVKFGEVNWTNHERLSKVAQVVQQNENVGHESSAFICGNGTWLTDSQRSILVKVLRETTSAATSQTFELRLTPRRNWGGRGTLGCHLVPI